MLFQCNIDKQWLNINTEMGSKVPKWRGQKICAIRVNRGLLKTYIISKQRLFSVVDVYDCFSGVPLGGKLAKLCSNC